MLDQPNQKIIGMAATIPTPRDARAGVSGRPDWLRTRNVVAVVILGAILIPLGFLALHRPAPARCTWTSRYSRRTIR